MKRYGRLKRQTRLRAINPARRGRKYLRNFAGRLADGAGFPSGYDHSEAVRRMACAASDFSRYHQPIEAAHAAARGMGGAKGTWADLIPLCRSCHARFDVEHANDIERFGASVGKDLRGRADRLAIQAWEANGSGDEPAEILEAIGRLEEV